MSRSIASDAYEHAVSIGRIIIDSSFANSERTCECHARMAGECACGAWL